LFGRHTGSHIDNIQMTRYLSPRRVPVTLIDILGFQIIGWNIC